MRTKFDLSTIRYFRRHWPSQGTKKNCGSKEEKEMNAELPVPLAFLSIQRTSFLFSFFFFFIDSHGLSDNSCFIAIHYFVAFLKRTLIEIKSHGWLRSASFFFRNDIFNQRLWVWSKSHEFIYFLFSNIDRVNFPGHWFSDRSRFWQPQSLKFLSIVHQYIFRFMLHHQHSLIYHIFLCQI